MLRLAVVAIGGWMLAVAQMRRWTIFALVALETAAYGLAMVVAVRAMSWGIER